MEHNESFDPSKLPAKCETLWTADLRKLLDVYAPETIEDLMAYSQSDSQRKYNWQCKAFCAKCERNVEFMEKLKKTSVWDRVWRRYIAIVTTGCLPSQRKVTVCDDANTVKYNLEDDDDELA